MIYFHDNEERYIFYIFCFILLYQACKVESQVILFDTGSCTHLRLLNITEITGDFGARFCEEILGIYCYTGEDCNCAFAGKGKVNPMKELEKNPRCQDSFA